MAKAMEKRTEEDKDNLAATRMKASDSSGKDKPTQAKNGKSKDKDAAKVKKIVKKTASQAPGEPNFYQKTKQFFKEVRIELKKVTWPTRKETMAATSVVLVVVFLVAPYLGLVDIVLNKALKLLMH